MIKRMMVVMAVACAAFLVGCGEGGSSGSTVSRAGYEKLLNQMEYSAKEKASMLKDFDEAPEAARKIMYSTVEAGAKMVKDLNKLAE